MQFPMTARGQGSGEREGSSQGEGAASNLEPPRVMAQTRKPPEKCSEK